MKWTSAKDPEALVQKFDSALRVVPGLWVSFTQPLAMRLDEAESGIRTDLGIKVVGPDLEKNQQIASRIRGVVASVQGSADVGVEVSEGTGQVRVQVRRDALAQFGLSVRRMCVTPVNLALGSETATEIVKGPRRIGVAVRFPDAQRNDLTELSRLMVRAPRWCAGATVHGRRRGTGHGPRADRPRGCAASHAGAVERARGATWAASSRRCVVAWRPRW